MVDYTTFFSLLLSILLRLTITLGVSPAKNIVIFLHDFPFFSQSFHTVVFFFHFASAAAASSMIPFHVFAMISGTCVAFVCLPFFAQRFPTKRQLFYNSLYVHIRHTTNNGNKNEKLHARKVCYISFRPFAFLALTHFIENVAKRIMIPIFKKVGCVRKSMQILVDFWLAISLLCILQLCMNKPFQHNTLINCKRAHLPEPNSLVMCGRMSFLSMSMCVCMVFCNFVTSRRYPNDNN